MRRSAWWPGVTLCILAMVSVASAATTIVDIQLGDTFTGRIDTAGVDFVGGRFAASQGTNVTITVRADHRSTLEPTVTVKDSSGNPLSLGSTQRIRWLPVRNLVHYFTVPATGSYIVEVGGLSGSGEFWARVFGDAPGLEMTTLSGTVRSSLTGEGIAGVQVILDGTLFAITDAAGSYSGDLLPGNHSVSFSVDGFHGQSRSVTASAGSPQALDVSLLPLVPVVIEASVSGDAVAGGTMTATVEIQMPAGSTLNSIAWTQEYGAAANIVDADTATATITMPTAAGYKQELIHLLSEPPVGEDELPPNVHMHGEFHGGLQDRFQVVGINPFVLEEAAMMVLNVEVDTEFGVFSDEVEVHASLPWKTTLGLRNVPNGVPVLLHGKTQASYDWVLIPPPGSQATLVDATTQNPYFIPDVSGRYELEIADLSAPAGGPTTMEIYSGTWRGTVVDQDIDGRPVADTACTFCHDDLYAADKFTPWMQTGHAEIFTDNINTSSHYSSSCFGCHTVGYDNGVDNAGIDEASDYQSFMDAGMLGNPGDNWTQVLEEFPGTARFANIQCENCHGPQDSLGHGFGAPLGDPRVSLSSDVCAVCHGEPLRHARFQQWQLSAHANYDLARDEGDSGNCSRCHTGNGFLRWLPVLLDDDPQTDPLDNITVNWTSDEVHPQTCATCHDPHAEGSTTGAGTNATVRISGDTPPLIAGFKVTGAGRGAICMTCHNSRRGLRNDSNFDQFFGTSEAARAPHGSAQTDLLVGQNAYLTEVDRPGGHATLGDTCIDCHMESTPPPDVLAYQSGGTNHTFFASGDICGECHSAHLTAADVQGSVQQLLDQLQGLVEDGLADLMGDLIAQGYTLDLNGEVTINDMAVVEGIEFGEYHGRQSMVVTVGGQAFGPHQMTDVDVVDAAAVPPIQGQLYDFANPVLIKSGWNWNLVHNDGSLGIHNPFFAIDVLASARDALVSVPSMKSEEFPLLSPDRTLSRRDTKIRRR